MASEPGTVLVIDDEREFCRFVVDCLEYVGHRVTAVQDGESALTILGRDFDVVICDYKLKGLDGMRVVSLIHEHDAKLPVILATAFGSIDQAVEAMRVGAYDYVTKPISIADLRFRVQRAIETRRLHRELRSLRALTEDRYTIDGLVARSEGMRVVVDKVRQLAESRSNVLVSGESGTGKELIARAIHLSSSVRKGPFVAVNCAAIPHDLLESELFGYRRGAFTGADRDKQGLFRAAHGGSLFFDEVGELPAPLQAKLLRVLEDGSIRPLGATESERVDVRVISATNRDLAEEVAAGRFRADLYYRLDVVEIRIPPLRERREDLALLIDRTLERLATAGEPKRLTDAARRFLLSHPWPGNIRQLQNALEHAATLTTSDHTDLDDLPESPHRDTAEAQPQRGDAPTATLREVEDAYTARVLAYTRGNRSAAAAILGIDRKTLYQRLRALGVDLERETKKTAG